MGRSLILASQSEIRGQLLRNAGVEFEVRPARVDETAILQSLQAEGAPVRDIVDALAEAKARKVSLKEPDAMVLGCDQIAVLDGDILQKPTDKEDAQRQLQGMSGAKHHLLSAAVIYENGEPQWRHVSRVGMYMHQLNATEIATYVERNWSDIQHCVGCYMVEKAGIGLFSRIEGDYFAVLGMPLLEILTHLRLKGVTPL